MPPTTTAPGVYVVEAAAGRPAIIGAPTAVTAFVGRAARGPVEQPTMISSFADFERQFGGLCAFSTMSYAVRDYFANGGKTAIIVRLFSSLVPQVARLAADTVTLRATNPGSWGNSLRISVARGAGDHAAATFALSIHDAATGATENFTGLSLDPGHPRRADGVLEAQSSLVCWDGAFTERLPPASHAVPTMGDDPWRDNVPTTNSKALVAVDDGASLDAASAFLPAGAEAAKSGLYALDRVDAFNLLCISPHSDTADLEPELLAAAVALCERRRALLIVDSPRGWTSVEATQAGGASPMIGPPSANAALFFPRLVAPDPLRGGAPGHFAPCGAVAGVFARTDAARGVWKAPAGSDARLIGVAELALPLTDIDNGRLNPLGINCLRRIGSAGPLIWGARTRLGNDALASEWKYVPVRRTALFIEASLTAGLGWAAFETNDDRLWAAIRVSVGTFLDGLYRQGAFQGATADDAWLVRCDATTTSDADISAGMVNLVVGFAPLRPAEFVMLRLVLATAPSG